MSNTRTGALVVNDENRVTATETVSPLSNAAAGTSATFALVGGKYQLAAVATWGSLVMNQLGPDGATWLPVTTAQTVSGVATVDLPPGSYQLVATGGSAYYATISRIPTA